MAIDGRRVGAAVGVKDGRRVGAAVVGAAVGVDVSPTAVGLRLDGEIVGPAVRTLVGATVGRADGLLDVGSAVGANVGGAVGDLEGGADGRAEGLVEGLVEGAADGAGVGGRVGSIQHNICRPRHLPVHPGRSQFDLKGSPHAQVAVSSRQPLLPEQHVSTPHPGQVMFASVSPAGTQDGGEEPSHVYQPTAAEAQGLGIEGGGIENCNN